MLLGADKSPTLRIAPGIVTTESAPRVLEVRPLYRGSSRVAGVWEAWIDDRDGGEPAHILTQGPKPILFLERYCVTTQAKWAGEPFKVIPWQRALLIEAFELVWDTEKLQFGRRYNEVLLGTPKKAGKSDTLGGMAHYFLHADQEPSPLVVTAAANDESANLVFTPAKTMVSRSGGAIESGQLEEWCDAWEDRIVRRGEDNAMVLRVPASPKAVEGKSIFVNLMDEWHEWTHPAAVQTATKLLNGTVLRPRYMNWRTTTAGFDPDSLCGQDYEFGQAVSVGDVYAPEWFFRWYQAPEDLDWRSQEAVRLANPSYGTLSQWEYYEKKQRTREGRESVYRRYFLNQWTSSEEGWLPSGAWEACEVPGLTIPDGSEVAIGVDASLRNDATAIVIGRMVEGLPWDTEERMRELRMRLATLKQQRARKRVEEEIGALLMRPMVEYFECYAYIWERPLDPETRKPDPNWRVPRDEVKATLLREARRLKVRQVDADPTFFHEAMAELRELGLPVREFWQSSLRNMSSATQGVYDVVMDRRLRHPGDRRFSLHVKNAVAKQLASGSAAWVLRKGLAKRPMDAAVALALAKWGWDHPEEKAAPKKAPGLHVLDD